MKIEVKDGVKFLYPDDNKKIKKIDDTSLYSIVALAKDDSEHNYEEVDEDWVSEYLEGNTQVTIEPDSDGMISYEVAKSLLNELSIMKRRIENFEAILNQK